MGREAGTRRRAAAVFAGVVVAVLGYGAIAGSTGPTSAAWNNVANLSATAAAGSWTVASGGSCDVIDAAGNVVTPNGCSLTFGPDTDGQATVYNIKATVSTTSTVPVRWRATINFSDTTTFGFIAKYVGEYAGNWSRQALAANFCTTTPRNVVYVGRDAVGSTTVDSANARTLDFVGTNSGPVGNYVVYSCP